MGMLGAHDETSTLITHVRKLDAHAVGVTHVDLIPFKSRVCFGHGRRRDSFMRWLGSARSQASTSESVDIGHELRDLIISERSTYGRRRLHTVNL